MSLTKAIGILAWLVVSLAAAGAIGEEAGPPGSKTIGSNRVLAAFDEASGALRLQSGGRQFAVARFADPGRATAIVEKVGPETPFGPGWMMKIGPGENRVLIREGSSLVLIRRDGRFAPATPGNRVQALEATLDLELEAANLKGLGADGLFDPAKNPGQHVVAAIADPATGAGVVAGLVRIDAVSGVLLTKVERGKVVLTLRNDYGSAVPPESDPFGGDWWALGWFGDARDGLECYASEFAHLHAVKLKPAPVGFMTWYSERYGGALNETAVIELSKYLADKFKDFGYGFVQIDDLWQNGQKRNGPAKDFSKVNPKGPYKGGMKPVADQIRALGLTPGLWLLPFAIDHKDPVLADRVPLVARTADGSPFETNWSGTALDLTRPETRQYVQGFIRQTVRDWGFSYLKLDGLHIGMATRQTYPSRKYVEDEFGDAVFADKTRSNVQAGRMGLAAVREAAGPDTFILGCCTPQNERSLGMALGLVDAMRVGPDSGVKWSGVVEGVRSSSALYFLNGRVWWNDPDAIYARTRIPFNEVQCFAGWVTLTGMLNNQTDWAPDYPAERVDLLRRTMPCHQLTSVRPVDLFENDPPRVWVLNYDAGGVRRTTIGLFNWGDKDADISASAQRLGLRPDATYAGFEFWSSRTIPPLKGRLGERLPPRTSRILAVREIANHPLLLGTSRHVTQGAVDVVEEAWNASQQTLSGAGRVVGGDPYELRVLATSGPSQATHWQATKADLSADDRAAGATAQLSQDADLVRVKILSPTSRTVRWRVSFSGSDKLASWVQRADAIIDKGPYKPEWESLKAHKDPEWFRDAKFGIYTHWGPVTVGSEHAPSDAEWYGQQMYLENHAAFKHHQKRFGDQRTVGYKDVIPQFKAEKFNADAWADLFARAGARFAGPVAVHHDSFANWDSQVTRWNSKGMGPMRDLVGELEKAIRARGMRFFFSFHHGFAWRYFEPAYKYDAADPQWADLYGQPHGPNDPPDQRFLDQWLAMVDEPVAKYQPDLIWFDFELGSVIPDPYRRRMFALVYDWAEQNGRQIGVAHKHREIHQSTGLLDFERGREDKRTPYPWLTDSSVGPWFHHECYGYRPLDELIDVFVDIVSKNGCLLLNVGPRSDGTIPDKARALLLGIGKWLEVNGEAIYGTRPWLVFGEGPTRTRGGGFSESREKRFTAADVRFTTKGKALYAIALAWPEDRTLLVRSLASDAGKVTSVKLLGHSGDLKWSQSEKELAVTLPAEKPCEHAFALEILGEGPLRPSPAAQVSAPARPSPDGTVALLPDSAVLHGVQVWVEEQRGHEYVAAWDSPQDWVSWRIDLGVTGLPRSRKTGLVQELENIGHDKNGLLRENIGVSEQCDSQARRPSRDNGRKGDGWQAGKTRACGARPVRLRAAVG